MAREITRPEFDDPRVWDLNGTEFDNTNAIQAHVEAIGRMEGVNYLKFGFREEDKAERWPDKPITAFAKVKYTVQFGLMIGRYFDVVEVKCERGTEIDFPEYAMNEALAQIIRMHGGKVNIEIDRSGE